MFNLFKKNNEKKLQNEYENLMSKAVDAQRNGNIKLYAELSFKADEVLKKIDKIVKVNEKN